MHKLDTIKQNYSPDAYYAKSLLGKWGKSTGNGWFMWDGLCPFHKDKKSGSLVINRMTGAFKCFSCGASGGDIINFHQKYHFVTFSEALNQLLEGLSCKK